MKVPDRKIPRFLLQLGGVMILTGAIAATILFGLAWLFPYPPDSFARHLRNGAGLGAAIVIGLRISRWLERRWSRD